ncbi:MAG: homocysteine S-methyltransferase family protein, partial [Acidobacteriota bacterium]|nr:homocysteine S-methyltransferase family protein [Acidobacteriota bacterium]
MTATSPLDIAPTRTRQKEFREQLGNRVMVADGAMGTVLYSKGIFINRCFDELNLSAPALVKEIHQEYVKAGAEILETNTFGANRLRLAAFGLVENLVAINHAGVRLAREAAQGSAFVAGAIGPLGVRIEPLGPTSFVEARAIFREQVEALNDAGIDLLVLETFYDLNELREAIFAARAVLGPEPVIIAHVTIDDNGHMRDGTAPETYTRLLDEWPVDVIGLNCSVGPKATLETIEQMMRYSGKPMSAMPNAGFPSVVEGRNIYLCSPEYMAQYARRFFWAGVKIVGGCCGTTAEHIKLIRSEARSLQPLQPKTSALVREDPVAKTKALPKVP